MRNPGRLAPYVITFLLGTTLAGGISAVASTASSGVKVCVNSHGLVVAAKAKSCSKGSHAMTISRRGPKGSSGVKGKPGANGYSVAYSGRDLETSDTNLTSAYLAVNEVLNLPAGSYVGNYQVNVYNNDTGTGAAQCHFAPGGNVNAYDSEDSDIDVPGGEALSVVGTNAFTLTQPGEVDVVCNATSGPQLRVLNADVDLLRVNTVVPS